MPRNRWTLDASTKVEYAKLTKRMRAAGADLAPPESEAEWIEVRHYPAGGAVRSWSRATVFVLSVRIVGIAPKIVIQGFELSSPGWDLDLYILEDPAARSSRCGMYRTLDGSRYDRREILNHRLGREGILRRGDVIEGWLLAECMSAAPTRYIPSTWLPLSLSIENQFGEVHRVSFQMPVERIRRRIQPRAPRISLFNESLPKSVDTAVGPIESVFGEAVASQTERGNWNQLDDQNDEIK
jgi:hypothetical protein